MFRNSLLAERWPSVIILPLKDFFFLGIFGLYFSEDSWRHERGRGREGERERERERERGEWHAAKGRRSELNPGPLRRGVNLYIWAPCSTSWAIRAPASYTFVEILAWYRTNSNSITPFVLSWAPGLTLSQIAMNHNWYNHSSPCVDVLAAHYQM